MATPVATIEPDYHHLYAEDRAYAKDGGTATAPTMTEDTGAENGVESLGKTKPIVVDPIVP
jgi:hypothetical protein